jgi:peroxiredoxin
MLTQKPIISILLLISFYSGYGQQKNFKVVANLTGFRDSTKFYLINLDSSEQTDSAYLLNGKIKFSGQIHEPVVFRLVPKLLNESVYFNFWIENKMIILKGAKDKFSELLVIGSPINTIWQSVEGKHAALDKVRNRLTNMTQTEKNNDFATGMWKSIAEIDKEVEKIRLETIATMPPSIVTIKELFYLRNDITTDSLQMFLNKFPAALKLTKYGQIISTYLNTKDLKIGSIAPQIIAKDLDGNLVKLSDFKGKLILLDFWASWCGPCIESKKDLRKLYQKYSATGFEILSFSLDDNKSSWKNASIRDRINWINVSDLKAYYSKQAALYKVRGIPKSYLIDAEGIILRIFDGFSPNLSLIHI